jgi:hypothetical protein
MAMNKPAKLNNKIKPLPGKPGMIPKPLPVKPGKGKPGIKPKKMGK